MQRGVPPVFVLIAALLGLGVGAVGGFLAGVASVQESREFFVGLFESERAADVDAPQTLDRPAFRLRYPGNWEVVIDDPDDDPDHQFSVDSPGNSMVMFQIYDSAAVSPEDLLNAQVEAFTASLISNSRQTAFGRWGEYSGAGAVLEGRILGVAPGTIRVFAFAPDDGHRVVVISQTYDDDERLVRPGIDLVERSFTWKGAPPAER